MTHQTRLSDLLDVATPSPPDPPDPVDPADADDDADDFGAPTRARRIPRLTLALLVVIGLVLAFTVGVAVQKHATASGTAASGVSSFPGGFPAGGFPGGLGGTSTTGTSGSTSTGSVPVVVGTVVKVTGTQVTVKDLGGTTHTVRTTPTTKVTSQKQVKLNDLSPGQAIRINGTKTGDGSVDATGVTAQ
ncbi:MAG: hypothetical protein ACOH1Y_15365 [Propionicimonas sp.]